MMAVMAAIFTPQCPECGKPWDERRGLIGKSATCFDDCAFRCHQCGLAFSNAALPVNRVLITRTPELNVPAPARRGLHRALAGAATVGNRAKKRKKFCSAKSEDAVTWTVIVALLETKCVDALVRQELGPPLAVLLWGHPVSGPEAADVAARLVAVSDCLREHPQWRSEPDVIVLWPQLLVFVEAKYGSGNDHQPHYKGYATYLPAGDLFEADDAAVIAEGSYQLARNWVIGSKMAYGLDQSFRLINLAPHAAAHSAARFARLLRQTSRRAFEHRTWSEVLDAAATPAWLSEYSAQRNLNAS